MTTRLAARSAVALCIGSLGMAGSAGAASPASGEWHFKARLDDKPIGEHRFSVTADNGGRTVHSEATFAVSFIGITAYRYHHQDVEHWRGDCLQSMNASTDDDGKKSQVRAETAGDKLNVRGAATESVSGCVLSFAYWNPAIQTQTRLLNAQTGKLESVQISQAGSGEIEVRGKKTTATRWRITGAEQPIDVWYSPSGDWIGLDSVVTGGRKLSYRLE